MKKNRDEFMTSIGGMLCLQQDSTMMIQLPMWYSSVSV